MPVGVLLSGGLDSSLVVALLAAEGQSDLATFSIGFESQGGREGDEFKYSDIIAREFRTDHHQIHIAAADLADPLERAVAAMSEPMVSHDCVAFYLLSEAVARHLKVVQSGQGADEILGGYHWYPPLVDVPRGDALDVYAPAFFDRDDDAMAELVGAGVRATGDPSRAYVRDHFAAAGADTAVDAALRIDTGVMLVEDPVKRVDNMTMAHGLEARVPFLDHEFVELAATCPPDLKLAQGGKGVLKDIGRRLLPHEVIDRPKGYFPVPGITHLEGTVLERVREALHAPEARARGLFRDGYVGELLRDPNAELTPLRGNKLWQLACWRCGFRRTACGEHDRPRRGPARARRPGRRSDPRRRAPAGGACRHEDPGIGGPRLRVGPPGVRQHVPRPIARRRRPPGGDRRRA